MSQGLGSAVAMVVVLPGSIGGMGRAPGWASRLLTKEREGLSMADWPKDDEDDVLEDILCALFVDSLVGGVVFNRRYIVREDQVCSIK